MIVSSFLIIAAFRTYCHCSYHHLSMLTPQKEWWLKQKGTLMSGRIFNLFKKKKKQFYSIKHLPACYHWIGGECDCWVWKDEDWALVVPGSMHNTVHKAASIRMKTEHLWCHGACRMQCTKLHSSGWRLNSCALMERAERSAQSWIHQSPFTGSVSPCPSYCSSGLQTAHSPTLLQTNKPEKMKAV